MVRLLKIGILMQATRQWMGGVVYIQNLVKSIDALPVEMRSQIDLTLIISPDSEAEFYNNLLPLVDKFHITDYSNSTFSNKIRRRLARTFPAIRHQVVSQATFTQGQSLDFYYPVLGHREFLWDCNCNWAAWIPDFQHKYLTEFFSDAEITERDHLIQKIADQAPAVVFSSQVAADDFRKFFPNASIQTFVLKFRTIPEARWFKAEPISVQKKYHLPTHFFLVSNQFWIHKNHRIIIQALKILKQEGITPTIVCTGELEDHRFPGYSQELLELIRNNNLDEQFYFLGLVPRFEQIQLMRCAVAVIQPSLFEGWSTVVEDARLLGKVLILSDLPVHLEQNPPQAVFFSRYSETDLAEKIRLALTTLTPGPNLESEITAQQFSSIERQLYAETFLKIAKACSDRIQVEY